MTHEEILAAIKAIRESVAERDKKNAENVNGLSGRLVALEQRIAEAGDDTPHAIRGLGMANPFASEQFQTQARAIGERLTAGVVSPIPLPGVGIKQCKSLVNLPEGGATFGFPTQPQRGPTLPPVPAPLTLVDLLPSTPVSSNSYEHIQLSHTSAAAVQQNEGDEKPESEVTAELVTSKIATIADWTLASRQVLSDNSQLSNVLSNVLSIGVLAKYENLLLNGNGTTDQIHGLLPQAPFFPHNAGPKADRISECIADMWASNFIANVLVLSPADWSRFETERAEGGDGQYIAGGGWANPAAPAMWRVPVARAASLAEGTALVLDTRFVTMLDRQQVTAAVSTEDRDNFIRNMVTLLAEMRGGLAVYNTGALARVDLAST